MRRIVRAKEIFDILIQKNKSGWRISVLHRYIPKCMVKYIDFGTY